MDGPSLTKCKECEKYFAPGKKAGGTFCSRSCASKFKWKVHYGLKPNCACCGKELENRTRKFCGGTCQQVYYAQKNINDWLTGEVSGGDANGELKKMYKRYLLNVANNECTKCGWGETNPHSGQVTLTIDHINGDAQDNRIDNLEVLCYNCHTLTPTFNQLNRGKGTRKVVPGTRR